MTWEFFKEIHETMRKDVLLVLALNRGEAIAGATVRTPPAKNKQKGGEPEFEPTPGGGIATPGDPPEPNTQDREFIKPDDTPSSEPAGPPDDDPDYDNEEAGQLPPPLPTTDLPPGDDDPDYDNEAHFGRTGKKGGARGGALQIGYGKRNPNDVRSRTKKR